MSLKHIKIEQVPKNRVIFMIWDARKLPTFTKIKGNIKPIAPHGRRCGLMTASLRDVWSLPLKVAGFLFC